MLKRSSMKVARRWSDPSGCLRPITCTPDEHSVLKPDDVYINVDRSVNGPKGESVNSDNDEYDIWPSWDDKTVNACLHTQSCPPSDNRENEVISTEDIYESLNSVCRAEPGQRRKTNSDQLCRDSNKIRKCSIENKTIMLACQHIPGWCSTATTKTINTLMFPVKNEDGVFCMWLINNIVPVISVSYAGTILHYKIHIRATHDGSYIFYIFKDQKESASIEELLLYHRKYGLRKRKRLSNGDGNEEHVSFCRPMI